MPRTNLARALGVLPPFAANRLRTFTLRSMGLELGSGTIFFGAPTLVGEPGFERLLKVGKNCGFNVGTFFELYSEVTLEDDVAFGHHVMVLTRGPDGPKPVRVGRGAWLGARCTLMPGVTVGEGAVVGAQMVIDADVPPNTLCLGRQRLSLAKWR